MCEKRPISSFWNSRPMPWRLRKMMSGMSAAAYMVFGAWRKPVICMEYAAVMFSLSSLPTVAALNDGSIIQ